MHILIGAAMLAGLIGFAFGETAARAFVGLLLAVGAFAIVGLISIALLDSNRQEAQRAEVVRPVSIWEAKR